MKILEIIYGLSSGGAERLVVDLCNELVKKEDVTLLVLKDIEQYYAPQLDTHVKVIYAKFPIGKSIKQHLFVYHFIKKLKPNIVHYHSAARYTTLLSNILLGQKIKFYMTIHNDVEKSYKNGVSGLQVRLAHYCGHTRFITISKENEVQFKRIYPNYKERLIVNGRAMPELSKSFSSVKKEINSLCSDSNTTVYLHIARCMPVKNQRLLIAAFNHHIANGANAILLIIGNKFDSELGLKLQQESVKNIYFLGTRKNVYDYMACSDAFCLSSTQEGMPMTIIEAILSGVPVISTPVCGAIDAVINKKNGLITEDYSLEAYYNAFVDFENMKQNLKANAMIGKENSIYNITHCAKEHMEWFHEG